MRQIRLACPECGGSFAAPADAPEEEVVRRMTDEGTWYGLAGGDCFGDMVRGALGRRGRIACPGCGAALAVGGLAGGRGPGHEARGLARRKTVRLVSPSRVGRYIRLELTVVGRRTGGPALEITVEDAAGYDVIAQANAGRVPITDEEYQALLGGDDERLLTLAARPGSNLRPLFFWEDSEATRLYRQRRGHAQEE
jgi:hypothetical protein